MAGDLTPNIGLTKPIFSASNPSASQRPWGQEMNANLDLLDGVLGDMQDAAGLFTKSVEAGLGVTYGPVTLGPAFTIVDISSNAAGRFRLYRSNAHRIADQGRAVTTPPTAGSGLILEVVFATGTMSVALSPAAFGVPYPANVSDQECSWQWEGGPMTITLTYRRNGV